MNTLIHGIHVKRLNLKSTLQVCAADADFSRLAHYSKEENRILNGGNPFISDVISQQAFDANLTLGTGVHLHFILPQKITTYSKQTDKVCPAPNRWMVKKTRNNKQIATWVIESDFLSERALQAQQTNTILPLDSDYLSGEKVDSSAIFNKGNSQPYYFMGRIQSAENYFSNERKGGKYWESFMSNNGRKEPFTAFAYGNLDFSSFYPNCKSVFGFHDAEGKNSDAYEVFGWYASSEEDKESEYLNQLNAVFQKENVQENLSSEFGLTNDGHFTAADQLLFHSDLISVQEEKTTLDTSDISIALGNDLEEVFSSWAAQQNKGTFNDKDLLEQKLEAIQFDLWNTVSSDKKPEFQSFRHARSFKTLQSNLFFDIEIYSTKKENQEDDDATLLQELDLQLGRVDTFIELKLAIEQLNQFLHQYEKQLADVYSKQQLLHGHWQKYLQAAHPPIGMADLLPDSNKVLAFIQEEVIPDLELAMGRSGWLNMHVIEEGATVNGVYELSLGIRSENASSGASTTELYRYFSTAFFPLTERTNSTADQVIAQLKKVKVLLDENRKQTFLIEHTLAIDVKHQAGQRYFEPTDPTVLLGGKGLRKYSETKSTLRDCFLLKDTSSNFKEFLKKIWKQTPVDFKPIKKTGEGVVPLFVDWEAYFYPVERINKKGRGYHTNYLKETFEVRENQVEFTFKNSANMKISSGVSRYTGRSSLSASKGLFLQNKIKKLSSEEKNKNKLIQIEKDLNENGFLVHELSGFNAAFRQEKNTLQLPVVDPIAFKDFKEIFQQLKIADYIKNQRNATPIPDFDFNPLRSGGLNLTRTNLIDTFGHRHPLFNSKKDQKKLMVTETMRFNRDKTLPYKGNNIQTHAFLYPRFIQSCRLNAHWLAANDESNKTLLFNNNSHNNPIFGWVVHNHLSDALSIYNAEGKHLGDVSNATPRFKRAPGEKEFSPSTPKNKYLQEFLKYLEGLSDMKAFLQLIEESLFYIDPENSGAHKELNYLFGKPLALARMQLNFEVQGDLLCRKDHVSFRKMLEDKDAEPVTSAYEKVEIPIHVGDYRKLNEGVILYWKDEQNKKMASPKVLSASIPQSAKTKLIKPGISQSLKDEPQNLTILLDPRGEVHISSGVLPMVKIRLADRYWKNALQHLQFNFKIGPVLFPKDRIKLNLPHENGMEWAWMQKRKTGWTKTSGLLTIKRQVLEKSLAEIPELQHLTWNFLLDCGVLITGVFGKEDTAYVLPQKIQENQKLSTKIEQEGFPLLFDFFERFGTQIKSFDTKAHFTQQELHQGWAEVYSSKIKDLE